MHSIIALAHRSFTVDRLLRLAIAALVTAIPLEAVAVLRETRGVWVSADWLGSPDRIRAAIVLARQVRANAVFVQVGRRGDAYYRSSLVPTGPRDETAAPDFDPLATVLAEGHSRGIAVHAWLNMFYVWSDEERPTASGHVLAKHPAWVLRDDNGTPLNGYTPAEIEESGYEGLYLEPGNSSVRHHLRQIVRELLAKYSVDGVHLDYVRYPTAHCGYTTEARRILRNVSGREIRSTARLGTADQETVVWRAWRAGQINKLIRGISRDVAAILPGACVTAAVVPDPTFAYELYGQDWVSWLNEGLVDAVVTMTYSVDDDLVKAQVAAGRKLTGPGGLYAGFGVFNLTCQQLIGRVEMAREVGCDGVVLYSIEQLSKNPAYTYGLSLGPFREPAVAHRCKVIDLSLFRPAHSPWELPKRIGSGVVPSLER